MESIKRPAREPLGRLFERLLIIPILVETRGWPYIMSWAHRISGVILSLFLGFHLYTLLLLKSSGAYDSQMVLFSTFPFKILAWLLAFPVIFHALNGGRMILYESFGKREDSTLIRAVFILSAVYLINLGILMKQAVSISTPQWFWVPVFLASLIISFFVLRQLQKSRTGVGWKLQRVTGSFLMLMIPAHMIFMHMHPEVAHSASIVTQRLQNGYIRIIGILLVAVVLFHCGYGLTSLLDDYFSRRFSRIFYRSFIWSLIVLMAFFAIDLLVSI